MAKNKNYLNNEDLKAELLNCINQGYDKAVSNGFIPDQNEVNELIKSVSDMENAVELGYNPERSVWIQHIRSFDTKKINEIVASKELNDNEINALKKQMVKPIVSNKLGEMFQLIVKNVSKSFFWVNPDDGQDCCANALLDLCSNFWKFEPVDSNGKANNAFAFCTQIAYFGIAGAHRILHPKKYNGTVSISCLDDNGNSFDFYSI